MGLLHLPHISMRGILLGAGATVAALGLGNGLLEVGNVIAPRGNEALAYLNLQNVNARAIYDTVLGLMVIVIPVMLSWYTKTYLKSVESQKRIAVITTLASAAINYAEDCESRGELELAYHSLDLPESMTRSPSPGHQKLCVAASWLVGELEKLGIKRVSLEEAAKWIASEFHKNAGDLRARHSISALADLATDLLGQLGRGGHITLPTNTLDAAALIQSIADWATSHMDEANVDTFVLRDAAMARIAPRSLMMAAASTRTNGKVSPEVRLTVLAKQAVDFVAELEKQGKLRMSEKETANAWLIQQVQQGDIPATSEQIEKAVASAFEQGRTAR